jgi:hypothetical protein
VHTEHPTRGPDIAQLFSNREDTQTEPEQGIIVSHDGAPSRLVGGASKRRMRRRLNSDADHPSVGATRGEDSLGVEVNRLNAHGSAYGVRVKNDPTSVAAGAAINGDVAVQIASSNPQLTNDDGSVTTVCGWDDGIRFVGAGQSGVVDGGTAIDMSNALYDCGINLGSNNHVRMVPGTKIYLTEVAGGTYIVYNLNSVPSDPQDHSRIEFWRGGMNVRSV